MSSLLTLAGAVLGVLLRALAEGPRAFVRPAWRSWLTGAAGGLALGIATGAVFGRAVTAGSAQDGGSVGGVLLSAGLFTYCVLGAAVWRLVRDRPTTGAGRLLRDAVIAAALSLAAATAGVLAGLALTA